MELNEAMRTQNACCYYKPDPIPEQVLYDAVELARFGPQGGNRQPVRFLIVRDEAKKKQLAEWYEIPWRQYIDAMLAGQDSVVEEGSGVEKSTKAGLKDLGKAAADADHFARHLAEHPAIIVVCAAIDDTHPTDTHLDRLSIVGGASVYPMAQNLCLALRDQGVATRFTTLLVSYEEQVKELLGIPPELSTAAHIVAGYPQKGFPKKLTRRPVEEIAFLDSFDHPLSAEQAQDAAA
jgi:nitroreductase